MEQPIQVKPKKFIPMLALETALHKLQQDQQNKLIFEYLTRTIH